MGIRGPACLWLMWGYEVEPMTRFSLFLRVEREKGVFDIRPWLHSPLYCAEEVARLLLLNGLGLLNKAQMCVDIYAAVLMTMAPNFCPHQDPIRASP